MPTIRLVDAASDAAPIADIYRPIVTDTAISFEVVPPTAEEIRERIARTVPALPWLVCEDGGGVVGYAYASRHRERAAYRWCADASVYVRVDRRRRGVARALYAAVFELLRLQGHVAVHAGITLPNPSSVALHEALGFRPVGTYPGVGYKLGAWHDVGWWQLTLRERVTDPAEPVAIDALDPSDVATALREGAALLRP